MFCPQVQGRFKLGAFERTNLAPLTETRDPFKLSELVDRIEKASVPYVVQAGTARPQLDQTPLAESDVPEPWAARVWVAETLFDRSLRVLAEVRGAPRQDG
jgi:hypothetical protein